MHICAFTNGSINTHFVGRKSLYRDKAHFLKDCLLEFDYILEDLLTDEEWSKRESFKDESIVRDNVYCRYYPRMPEEYDYLGFESGYLFCDKDKKEAFEVYVIEINELVESFKDL